MSPQARDTSGTDGGKWWAMFALGLGVLMATLDISIVNVSLPTLMTALQTDFATIQWVILSYVLMVTSLLLGVARLGDILGKRKIYCLGLLVFTAGSLLCGLAPTVGRLIAFRALQGMGAVMTQALGAAIVTEVFPPYERGMALGVIGTIVSVGLALGPAVGGILIGLAGWRSVFLVNVPLGLVAFMAVLKFVPRSAPARTGQRFDLAGAAVLFMVLGGYALGMTLAQRHGFGQWNVLLFLGLAVIGLPLFILIQHRLSQPMLKLALFKNTLFSINLLMSFLVFIVLGGTFITPFFLELVMGYPTRHVGLFMMVVPVCMGLIAPISGSLSDRFGPRGISLIGLMVVVGGCLSVSTLHAGLDGPGIALRLAPLGLGLGIFSSPNNSAIMGGVSREHLGVASGLMALSRNLGHSSGIPLIGVLFTSQVMSAGGLAAGAKVTDAPPAALVAGISGTYRVAALVVTASVILAGLALWLDRGRRRA